MVAHCCPKGRPIIIRGPKGRGEQIQKALYFIVAMPEFPGGQEGDHPLQGVAHPPDAGILVMRTEILLQWGPGKVHSGFRTKSADFAKSADFRLDLLQLLAVRL